MKRLLLDHLVCPGCLPQEISISCRIREEHRMEILEASLHCPRCGSIYPVREGVAFLLPESPGGSSPRDRYETADLLSSYLWSHYADLTNDPDAGNAYSQWARLVDAAPGLGLDAGCAVGRFTFELAGMVDFAVGFDRSFSFVREARMLAGRRRLAFALQEEGRLEARRDVRLPEPWDGRQIEFIVADAQAIPFRAESFSVVASLNVVDKIARPLLHLRELNRAAAKRNAQLLFSDPFSWSEEFSREQDWLGGTPRGPFSGRAADNVSALLAGKKAGFTPHWRIDRTGHLWWKIRNHANHFEMIRSFFLKADR